MIERISSGEEVNTICCPDLILPPYCVSTSRLASVFSVNSTCPSTSVTVFHHFI